MLYFDFCNLFKMESIVAPTSMTYFETTSTADYQPPTSDEPLKEILGAAKFILLYPTCILYLYVTIVLVVYRKKTFNSSFFHISIANAFADLAYALLVNKFAMLCSAATIKWNFIVYFIATIFSYSSMLGIMLLGLNRVTALMTTSHNSIWSPGHTAGAIACQWIISVFISLPFVVTGRLLYVAENGMMASENKKLYLGLILYSDISYGIFCAIICCKYIAAILGAFSRSKKLAKIVSNQSSHVIKRARRTNIKLLLVGFVLCFFLCISVATRFSIRYIPLFVKSQALWICTTCMWYVSMYAYLLANPWLLLLLCNDVRKKCKQLPHDCAEKLLETFDRVFYSCHQNSAKSEVKLCDNTILEDKCNNVCLSRDSVSRGRYLEDCEFNAQQEEFV